VNTTTLAFFGLGDSWELTDGLTTPAADKPNGITFAPDGKWLTVCSGDAVQVWKVPGSQKVSGKPRQVNPGTGGYTAAAAGPNNLIAVAERAEGKKVRVHLVDLATDPSKAVTTFATEIDDVSCLAFTRDGKTLAVADHVEGVVQLWDLTAKK
jgi:WD40 repeat protein